MVADGDNKLENFNRGHQLALAAGRVETRFIFHSNPVGDVEIFRGQLHHRLSVSTAESVSSRPNFVTKVDSVTDRPWAVSYAIRELENSLRLTLVIRTCQQCYSESNHIFYDRIYLGLTFDVDQILDQTEPQEPFTEAELDMMY